MSSYFSRLIQQTEIPLGTGERRKAEGKPPLFPPKGGEQKAEGIEPYPKSPSFLGTGREQELQSSEDNIMSIAKENARGTTSNSLPFQSMERQGDAAMGKAENNDISGASQSYTNNSSGSILLPGITESEQDISATPTLREPTTNLQQGDDRENSPQPKQLENRVELSSINISSSHDVETELNFAKKHPRVKSEKILESRTNIVKKKDASQSYQNISSGSILLPTITASRQDARTTNLQKLDVPHKTPQSPETLLQKQSVRSQEQNTLGESLSTKPKVHEPQRQSTAISQEYNPLPTRQVDLKTVREWVAGAEKAKLNTEPFQFPNPQPQEKPNFSLSIGTISLTVEAPPPEVQQPVLPSRKPQQKGKTISPTSRINRHYLRL